MILVNARFLTQKLTGVQRYATEISRQLKTLCQDIRFLTPINIAQKETAEEFGAEVIGTVKGHLWEQVALPFNLNKDSGILLCMANSAPVAYKNKIVTIHDTAFLNTDWVSWKFKKLYSFLLPRVIENSRKIVTVSEFSKSEILKHFNLQPSMVEVIPNAVSNHLVSLAQGATENQYGTYILGLSSLEPRKNFKNLILAFNRIQQPGLKLIIVGSGDAIYQSPQLSEAIGNNPNIVFTGYVDDKTLAGLYKHAQAFVFPSFYEGFGLPPLEAMAFGCPTIVSKTASLPEVCGDASVYIDPYDVESIQKGIEQVLSSADLRRQLVESGHKRVGFYGWEKSAQQYLELIQTVA